MLLLTYNEAPNIARTLDALRWARRIVIIDSGSTDATREIARAYANVEISTRPFDSHQAQWTFALSLCHADCDWILALDADHNLTTELCEELQSLRPANHLAGYRIGFRYCIQGRVLRDSLYPPVVALYRREGARYFQDGHTHRLVVDGLVADLQGRIHHDDRKPLADWLAAQVRYARLEAAHLMAKPRTELRKVDRLRRLAWPVPILILPYTLIVKRCILDGWPGWIYALQRTLAEIMLALEIADRRSRGS